MKKLFLTVLVILLVGLGFTACSTSSNGEDEEAKSAKLYLDVNFEENIIFSKYDVEVELNNEKIGTIKHGEYYTSLQDVPVGDCKIEFSKVDNSEIKAAKEIHIESNSTYKCTIISHSDEIEIKDEAITDGIDGSHLVVPAVVGMKMDEARYTLENAGFVNIVPKSTNEESVIYEPDWSVKEQSVAEGEEIDKNQEIILTCIKGVLDSKATPEEPSESKGKEGRIDEMAFRAAVVALTNANAADVFDDNNGNAHDPSKYHTYSDQSGESTLVVLSEGYWEKLDDNKWHVDSMLLKNKNGVMYDASLDVKYTGSMYTISNIEGTWGASGKMTNDLSVATEPIWENDTALEVTENLISKDR